MRNRLIFGSALVFIAGFYSCQKSDNLNNEATLATNLLTSVAEVVGTQVGQTLSANEYSIAVEKFNGSTPAYVFGAVGRPGPMGIPGWGMHGMEPLRFGVPHIDSCVTVTVSSSSYPREIVVEYLAGCSTHKHDKHGTVIINLSDTITSEGAVQTITYKDFYIDSIKVDLTATLKNLGKNSAGNWVIEKTYTQTMTKNEEVSVRTNTETVEWVTGFETTDKSDNAYYVSGSGSVVINDTASYIRTIKTPLFYDADCEFIKSGIVELNRKGNITVIDYGDGTCDDKATVTTNGTTEEINLHSNKFKEGGKFGKHSHGFGHKGKG